MLRNYIKNNIYDALNYGIFRFEDFSIEDDDYTDKICIKYNDYYFKMTINSNSNNCEIILSPGVVLMEEFDVIPLGTFIGKIPMRIKEWLRQVEKDMINPIEKRFIDNRIQEFKEEVESRLEEIEDNYFTKDEGDELRERLEQLEKMISEMDSQEELQAEISKMKEELKFLKATIDTSTKKKWFKNALVKFWSWGQKEENRKLIESGVEVVKTISQMDIPKL